MSTPPWPHDPPSGYASYGAGPPAGGPIHAGTNRPLASVGVRFGALVIDYLVVWLACTTLFGVMLTLVFVARPDVDQPGDTFDALSGSLFFLGWGVALFLYHWLCLMIGGRSVGRLLTRIRVVSDDGGPLTQSQAIVRSAIFGLPLTLPCLGHIFVFFECVVAGSDTSMRALHDRAARTVVIRV